MADSMIKDKDKKYIAGTYGRFDLQFVSGKGSTVYDETGKKYTDLGSGIAVNVFGHCDEVWTQAVKDQLDKFAHSSNLYYSEPQVKLAELLCTKTGMSKVFFGNSGAEANECAIKAARKYSSDKYGDGRNVIITLVNSFHGRTVTTLSATGQDVFHKDFGPFTEGFVHVPANDFAAMQAAVEKYPVCGIMMELVQGEGGVIALDSEYVDKVAALCKDKDIMLMIDEVQTGNGRSGCLYAFQKYGLQPDIVSTAKGLGGGLPIGACMLGAKCADVLGKGSHGSTFGGNPAVTAGAYSIISRIDDELLKGVEAKSRYIIDTLSKVNGVEEVTGLGLMLGIRTKAKAIDIVNDAIEHGVITLTAKDRIRLLPPLNIPEDQLKEAISVLSEIIEKHCKEEQ